MATHSPSPTAGVKAVLTILQAQRALFTIIPEAQFKLCGYSIYSIDAGIFLTVSILRWLHYDQHTITIALQQL